MVAVPSSTTRTRSHRDATVTRREPKVEPKAEPKKTLSTRDGSPTVADAAPLRRPTVESSADARRAQLANPALASLRTRLEGDVARGAGGSIRGLDGHAHDLTSRDTRGLPVDATSSARGPSGRRVSVDDPLARLAGDAPAGAPGHPSMRRLSRLPNEAATEVTGAVKEGVERAGEAATEVTGAVKEGIARAGDFVGGLIDKFKPKPEGFAENDDGSYTFNGGRGDDRYSVEECDNGSVTVTNDETGKEYTLTADQAEHGVTIDAGSGNDRVTVEESVDTPIAIEGGSGDDRIDARASRGDVRIDGGSGDDRLTGGSGNDAISGGTGDDRIDGGAGGDQLLGQDGDDRVLGGDGDDYVQGGGGADHIEAGAGGDAVYADALDTAIDVGEDKDLDVLVTEEGSIKAKNLDATDQRFDYDPAEVDAYLDEHPELVIDGSEDFEARTRADLGVMLNTEQGRGLLDELTAKLEEEGETLTFREKEGAGGEYSFADNVVTTGNWSEPYSDGSNRMPLPAMFHEMVHAYQDLVVGAPEGSTTFPGNADGTENRERQATGLPYLDEDGDLHRANELPYTDNRFREELGLPERTTYSGETGDPTGYLPDSAGDEDYKHGQSRQRTTSSIRVS